MPNPKKEARPFVLSKDENGTKEQIIRFDEQLVNIAEKLSIHETRLHEIHTETVKIPLLDEQLRDMKKDIKETTVIANKVLALEGKFAIAMLIIGAILTGMVTYIVTQATTSPKIVIQRSAK